MERYRVNYVLLVGLLVGAVLTSSAVYGLWRLQIDRNADNLIEQAQQAEKDGKIRDAAKNYEQFLSIRPYDQRALVARAEIYADISNLDDARPEELFEVVRVMEDTLRRLPENDELRKQLVEIYMAPRYAGFVSSALDHINIMLQRKPDDPDLQVLKARCLIRTKDNAAEGYSYSLIGFDPATGEFDVSKAKTPHEAIVYRNLADLLYSEGTQVERADQIIEQLVEANPDSFEAYLHRGQYYINHKQLNKGADDIYKAYELKPDDADVLLAIGNFEKENERYEEALRHFNTGREKHPKDVHFYQQLADVTMRQLDYKQALDYINTGLNAVEKRDAIVLVAYKADLQVRAQDLEGLRTTIDSMDDYGFRPEYIEWVRARELLIQGKWFEASQALRKVRPMMTQYAEVQTQIDVHLGLCYEKLGQLELALESYELALQTSPDTEPARHGQQRVLARLRPDEQSGKEIAWQKTLMDELAKPEAKQDWAKVDALMVEVADSLDLPSAKRKLMRAEILILRKIFPEARKLLREAYEEAPDDLLIRIAAIRLLAKDPDQGPVQALQQLEAIRTNPKFGDSPALRSEKADLFILINDTDLRAQLASLTEGIDDWPAELKVQLWSMLAAKYFQLGMRDDAKRCWTTVAELAPNDLPTRVMLFTLAHDENDDAQMQAAQDRILEVVKDKGDSTWLYSEARRMLSRYRRGQLGEEALVKIGELVDRAFQQRTDWHELHLLRAELAMMANKPAVALEHYDRASQLGRPYPAAIVQHVQLLVGGGRFAEARQVVERLPESLRQSLLGQLYAEILFNTNAIEEGINSAQLVIEQDPNVAIKQLWYGQLMARAAQIETLSEEIRKDADAKAGAAIERAVELGPGIQEAWVALVSYHVFHKEPLKAEEAVRRAQIALSGEPLPLAVAKCYELMGRWFDAETLFRSAFDTDPQNVSLAQQLASFYLGGSNPYAKEVKIAKATPLLNSILRAGAEKRIPINDQRLAWARRTVAELLAGTGDYQNILKAEHLLTSNVQDGALSLEDRLQLARLLASRPEPISRKKSLQILEEIKEMDRLNFEAELVLGQLYFALGDWAKCNRQMMQTISRYPSAARAHDNYIRMLLDHGETTRAAAELKELFKLAPQSVRTYELMVRVAAETGQQDKAGEALRTVVKSYGTDLSKLNEKQIDELEKVADLFVELGDHDSALQLYQLLVSKDPNKVFKLAQFVGLHRDVEQCFDLLDDLLTKVNDPNSTTSVIRVALTVLRGRRDDIGERMDERVKTWMDRAFRDDPESIVLLMQKADLLDLQEQYDEAVKVYRHLLGRTELTGPPRAVVLNNLSYILALQESSPAKQDAMKLVQEAVQILGPRADILDTRAVVFTAIGEYQDAIADLELSVTDQPTAAKYYHKVIAHLHAGQNTAALEAWSKALDLGLERESLNRLEREEFDEIKSKIEELQPRLNATHPENVRLTR